MAKKTKMKFSAYLILALLASTATVTATQQVQEILLYEGAEYRFGGNGIYPLFYFFADASPEVKRKWTELVVRGPNIPGREIYRSTACWRNYVGTWKLMSNGLYFVKADTIGGEIIIDDIEDIFKDYIHNDQLHAKWFNEDIVLRSINTILFFTNGNVSGSMKFNSINEMNDFIREKRLKR